MFRTFLGPSRLCQEESVPLCYGHALQKRHFMTEISASIEPITEKIRHFCSGHALQNRHFRRAYQEKRHSVTDISVSIEAMFEKTNRHFVRGMFCKTATLLRTFLCPSSLRRESRYNAILLRTLLCPSSPCQEEQTPFRYGHVRVYRAYVKKKRYFCLHRAYVKKEQRHFLTGISGALKLWGLSG